MYPLPVERWKPLNRALYKASLPLALLIWLLPMLAVLVTSIRSSDELSRGDYWTWPKHFALLENYGTALTQTPMLHYFANSVLITVPSVIGAIVLASMAGFALATYRFPGNTAVLFAFVAGNFVPIQILMIPVRDMALKVGLFNTVWALVIFHVSFQTGFCTLFLRNFIKQLPFEMIEAARVEGANEWTIYLRIVLPLVRPALAALGILVFTFVWNDYFWALCLTQGDEAAPITVGVAALKGAMDHRMEPGRGGLGAGRVAFRADVLRDAKAFRRRPDFRCKQRLSIRSTSTHNETFSCNLVFVTTRNNGRARCGPTTQSVWSSSA